MSIHAVAETTPVTRDAQVIADMAAAVLASVARIHADGLATVTALAEAPAPVRVALPPVAEAVVEEPAQVEEPAEAAPFDAELVDAELVDAELVDVEPIVAELVEAELTEEPADDEPVVRIAEPVRLVPVPRGRHFAEAVTDQFPAQRAA